MGNLHFKTGKKGGEGTYRLISTRSYLKSSTFTSCVLWEKHACFLNCLFWADCIRLTELFSDIQRQNGLLGLWGGFPGAQHVCWLSQHLCREPTTQLQRHLYLINSPKMISFVGTVVSTHERMLNWANLSTSGTLPHSPAEGRARCLSRK